MEDEVKDQRITHLDEKKGIYKEKLDIGSDDYEDICNKLKETCVDPFFEDRYWRIDKIERIKNKKLENGYNEMKTEMRKKDLDNIESRELYLFSGGSAKICDDICKDGHRTGLKKRPVLGHIGQGVHFVQHYDILTRYLAFLQFKSSIFVVVYKAVLGRAKKVDIFDSKIHNEPATPDVNFNCFVSEKQVEPKLPISDAMDRSFVYIYDFDKSSNLVKHMRRTLPYGLVTLERKPCVKLSTPFLAVESGGSDVRWEVQGETRRGFRWSVTKGASTRSLREKVDQVRRRRSQSKEKKQTHPPATEDCPPVLNRFDTEHNAKMKKRKSGDVPPPVLNEDGKLYNMIREIGSKKDRILQIKLQRGSKASDSNNSDADSVDVWNIVRCSNESEDKLYSFETQEHVSEQCVHEYAVDKLTKAEEMHIKVPVTDEKKTDLSKYTEGTMDNVNGQDQEVIAEKKHRDSFEMNEEPKDKSSNDEGSKNPESVTNESSENSVSVSTTDVAGNSFLHISGYNTPESYHKDSTIPSTMKPFINLTRIDSKIKSQNKFAPISDSDKKKAIQQNSDPSPVIEHQQNKLDEKKIENSIRDVEMTKRNHETEQNISKEKNHTILYNARENSGKLMEHDTCYQTQVQTSDSLTNTNAVVCREKSHRDVLYDKHIMSESSNKNTKERKDNDYHTKVSKDTKVAEKSVYSNCSRSDAKQSSDAKNKATGNQIRIDKIVRHRDEIKDNAKRQEKYTETFKLPKSKNLDMSNNSRVSQKHQSHSILKSVVKDPNPMVNTENQALNDKHTNSGKTSENILKIKQKANKDSFEDQLSKMDAILLNRKIHSIDNDDPAAKKKDIDMVQSHVEKQTEHTTSINAKSTGTKENTDIEKVMWGKDQHDLATNVYDKTDKNIRNSRSTISSKKSRAKGRSKSDTDKWKSFDITVVVKRSNSLQDSKTSTKHVNAAKPDIYPGKTTTADVAQNNPSSQDSSKSMIHEHHTDLKSAKNSTHRIITNKLQCDYLAALQLGPALVNTKKAINRVPYSIKQTADVVKENPPEILKSPRQGKYALTDKQGKSQNVSRIATDEDYSIMIDRINEQVRKTTSPHVCQRTHTTNEKQYVPTVLNKGGCGIDSALTPSIHKLGKSISPPAASEAPRMLNETPNVPSACKIALPDITSTERNHFHINTNDKACTHKMQNGGYDIAHKALISKNTSSSLNAHTLKSASSHNRKEDSWKNRHDLSGANKIKINSHTVYKSSSSSGNGGPHINKEICEVPPREPIVDNKQKDKILNNSKSDDNVRVIHKSGNDNVNKSISSDTTHQERRTSSSGTTSKKVDAETAKRLQRFLQKSMRQVHKKNLLPVETQRIQSDGDKRNCRSKSIDVLSKGSEIHLDCKNASDESNNSVSKQYDINSRQQNKRSKSTTDVANILQKNTIAVPNINDTSKNSVPEAIRPTLHRSDSQETVIGGINDLTVATSFRSPLEDFTDSQSILVPENNIENLKRSPNDQPLDLTMPKVHHEIITYPLDLTKKKTDVNEETQQSSFTNENFENKNADKSETTVSDKIDTSKDEKVFSKPNENSVEDKNDKNEKIPAVPCTKDTQSEITKTLHQLSQVLQEISKLSEEKVPDPGDDKFCSNAEIHQNVNSATNKNGQTNRNPLNFKNVTNAASSFDKSVNNECIKEGQHHDPLMLQKSIKTESSAKDANHLQGRIIEKKDLQIQDVQAMRDLYLNKDESENDVKGLNKSISKTSNLLKIRERHIEQQKRNVEKQAIESRSLTDNHLNIFAPCLETACSEGSHCTEKTESVAKIETARSLSNIPIKSEPTTDVLEDANTSNTKDRTLDLIQSDKNQCDINTAVVKKEPLDIETSTEVDKEKTDSATDTNLNNKQMGSFTTTPEKEKMDISLTRTDTDSADITSRHQQDNVQIVEKSANDQHRIEEPETFIKTTNPNKIGSRKSESQTSGIEPENTIPSVSKICNETTGNHQENDVLSRHNSVLTDQKPSASDQCVWLNDMVQNSEKVMNDFHEPDNDSAEKLLAEHSLSEKEDSAVNRESPKVFDYHGEVDMRLSEAFGTRFIKNITDHVVTRQTQHQVPINAAEAKHDAPAKENHKTLNGEMVKGHNTAEKSGTSIRKQSMVSSIHKRKHSYGSQKGWLNKDGRFISGIKKSKKDKEIHCLSLNLNRELSNVSTECTEKEVPENTCIGPENATDQDFVALRIDELLKSERKKSNTYSLPNTDEINEHESVPKLQNSNKVPIPDDDISDKQMSEHNISKSGQKQDEKKTENNVCSPNKGSQSLQPESTEHVANKITPEEPTDPPLKTFEELMQWKWRNRAYYRNRRFANNLARRYHFLNSGIKKTQSRLHTNNTKGGSDMQSKDRDLDLNANTDQLYNHVSPTFKSDSENKKSKYNYESKEYEGQQKHDTNERKLTNTKQQSNTQTDNRIQISEQIKNKNNLCNTFNAENIRSDQDFPDDIYKGFDAFRYRKSTRSNKKEGQTKPAADRKINKSSKKPLQKRLKSVCQALIPNTGNLRSESKRVLTENERKAEREKATEEIEDAIRHLRSTYEGTWEDMCADSKVASFLEKMADKLATIQIKRTKIEEDRQKWLDGGYSVGNNFRKWQPRGPWVHKYDGFSNSRRKRLVPDKRSYQKENSMQDMKETLRKEVEKVRRELTDRFISKLGKECTQANESLRSKSSDVSTDTNALQHTDDVPHKVQKSSSRSEERKDSDGRRNDNEKRQTSTDSYKRFECNAIEDNEKYFQRSFNRQDGHFNFMRNRRFNDTKFHNNGFKSKWWYQNNRGRFSKYHNNQSSRPSRGRSVNRHVPYKQTVDKGKQFPGSGETAMKNIPDSNTREIIKNTKQNENNSRRSRSSNGSGHRDRTSDYDIDDTRYDRQNNESKARSHRSSSHKSQRSKSKESCETYESYNEVGSSSGRKYNKNNQIKTEQRESSEKSNIDDNASKEHYKLTENKTGLDTIRSSYDSDTEHNTQRPSHSDKERSKRSPRSDKLSYRKSSQSERAHHNRSLSKDRNDITENAYEYGAYYHRRNNYGDSGRSNSKEVYIHNNKNSKYIHSGDRKRVSSSNRSDTPEKRLKMCNDTYERNGKNSVDRYGHKRDPYQQKFRGRDNFIHKSSNNYQPPFRWQNSFNHKDNYQNRPFYKRDFRQEFKKRF